MLRIRSRHILPLSYLALLGCGSQDPNPQSGAGETAGGSGSSGAPAGGQAGSSDDPGGAGGQPSAGAGGQAAGAGGAGLTGGSGGENTGGVTGLAGAGGVGTAGAAGSAGVGSGGMGGVTAGAGGNPLCETVYYRDADADGRGVASNTLTDCAPPPGYVDIAGDCNDADPNNWVSCATCRDLDTDGHFVGCDAYVTIKGFDCDDSRPWINKDMVDAPPLTSTDTEDWDCNGVDIAVDESVGAFVSPRGNDSNSGTRSEPVRTLRRGIEVAEAQKLAAVFVAAGTYLEDVHTSVSIFGGYDPESWERDVLTHVTRLAAPSDGAVRVDPGSKVALQGFEVQGATDATTSSSSPLRATNSTLVLHSVRVSGGNNLSQWGEVAGITTSNTNAFIVKSDVYSGTAPSGTYGVRAAHGWAYLEASSVSMSQITPAVKSAGVSITNGRGTFWASSVTGGRAVSTYGILAESSSGLSVVESSVHSGTSLSEWTGQDAVPAGCVGLRVSGGATTIESSVVMSAEAGTQCFMSKALDSAGSVSLVNALLHAGKAAAGAGFQQRSGQSLIVSSTLIGNEGPSGSAWELAPGTLGVAVNSIFSFHTETGISAGGTLQSLYNDIWSPNSSCLVKGGSATCAQTAQAVDANYCLLGSCGNISVDPEFDSTFQISEGSPCVNAGVDPTPWFSGPIVDLNGQLRPLGGRYDQGAFEVR
ncbi:MAG: choice-of-anchor Q domain-containing protein [Polyangiaceae bacterium]